MTLHLPFPGELPEVVRFGGSPNDFADFRKCGVVTGQWRATDAGALVVSIPTQTKTCNSGGGMADPAWASFAWSYRFSGPRLLVLNDDGGVQASMVRTSAPSITAGVGPALLTPPVPSAELLASLNPPAPLPAGMTAVVKPNQAGGAWLPSESTSSDDVLSLLSNHYLGTFRSCVVLGQLAYDATGVFIALGEAKGSCDALPLHSWLPAAARLGLDHGKLAFVDRNGHVLGELRPH